MTALPDSVACQPEFRLSPRTSQNGRSAPSTSSLAEVAEDARTRIARSR